jgi:D-alanine--poly(phosphoribitol) ligase subunit 1
MQARSYVHNLGGAFTEVAERNPLAPAIRFVDGREVNYGELLSYRDQLTRWLLKHDIGPRSVVALQNGKTLNGYAAMLACLNVGAAYLNLDVQNPLERLVKVLSICRPALVISDRAPAEVLAEAAVQMSLPLLTVPDFTAEVDRIGTREPIDLPGVTGADPAYLMFTSGSTGFPKGAAISHGSVLNFISWASSVFSIGSDDVLANVNPIYFDNSVFDFYAALYSGACLAPINEEVLRSAVRTVKAVDDAKCTVWFSVPSLLIYLMTMKSLRPDTFTAVRKIVFGGEGYPKSELMKMFNLYGARCALYNVYGPTECTCICSAYKISPDDFREPQGLPPLGRIADNFSYLILNDNAPVERGQSGELCLLGPQLGLGYYNDVERTGAAFIQNPLARALPEKMYRTGDLVREVDGLLHFVGRKDNQIKHMGYRIELEEIEYAIDGLDYVVQSAVVYKRVRESFGHIVAYVATESEKLTETELRERLASSLPSYMIPTRFVISSELPKTPNGKVDRARLKSL